MNTEFVEVTLDVLCRDRSGMAGETVHFFIGKVEKSRPGSSSMRSVAALATIRGDGRAGRVRPGIDPDAVPWLV